MKWKNYKVSELCSDIVDCVNKTAPISSIPTPYKMLRTSDIRNGFVNLDDLNCVSEDTYLKWSRRGLLKKGDIIFTREAPLGEVGLVREDGKYFLGQRLVLYRANPEVCDNRFLLYWFLNPQNKESIKSRGVGATVTHLRVPECEKIEIKAPDIETQRFIGSTLSAYDDLIENNQKQIKLLEEAAQRLYKQWFIDLKFPGYETTKIVDGLPEGWKKGSIGDIAEFKRGKVITKALVVEGNIPVVAGGLEPAYYHNVANTIAPVITVSGSGANAGFAQLYNENVFASDCSFADINTTPYVYFIYCLLKGKKTELDSLQKGAAQPHVYAKDINALATLIPPEEVLKLYTKYASPYFEKIKSLKAQIKNSTQSRDRLLPKLMNEEFVEKS